MRSPSVLFGHGNHLMMCSPSRSILAVTALAHKAGEFDT